MREILMLVLLFLLLVGYVIYKQWSFSCWIRKLDAEERMGIAEMEREWRENETKRMMEEYFKPVSFKKPHDTEMIGTML